MPVFNTKYFFPVFYFLLMALTVFYAWNEHTAVRRGGNNPIYRNLMEESAYIKRGFNSSEIIKLPAADNSEWFQYENNSRSIISSPLPDMTKRPFLSPFGREKEEFTILIPVMLDREAILFLENNVSLIPGMNFAAIGENWEIYLNGVPVKSEMHIDRKDGKIKILKNRSWRNVFFPVDRNLFVQGTNIIALRIIGDPSYNATGLSFRTHHYIDDYEIIKNRQNNISLIVLCSIFGFTGIYYLMLFLSLRDKREIFNLYFSIFSILLCVYSFTRHSIVNILIPDADISIRLEYSSMILLIPVFCLFLETLVRRKSSIVSLIYLFYCLYLALTQSLFSSQYGEDAVALWNVTVIIYCTYFFFFKLLSAIKTSSIFMYKSTKDKTSGAENGSLAGEASNINIIIAVSGMLCLYICGIYEILEVRFFRNNFSIFQYSIFAVHIGMAFSLAQRYNEMYKKLEHSNIKLTHTVNERTQELEKQTALAFEISMAKDKFLAVVNNELKTPLEKISENIRSAESNVENGNVPEAKNFIKKAWDETMQLAGRASEALDELQKTRSAEIINFGSLKFDMVSNRAFYDGKELPLAPKEFALLYLLVRNEGKVLNHKHLYEKVWNMEYNRDNTTVRGHIKNIKKKLEPIAGEFVIESSHGEGYCLRKV